MSDRVELAQDGQPSFAFLYDGTGTRLGQVDRLVGGWRAKCEGCIWMDVSLSDSISGAFSLLADHRAHNHPADR